MNDRNSGIVAMGDEYSRRYEGLMMAKKRTRIARVWPFPGAVVFEYSPVPNDELTPSQAIELAGFLLRAAEDAQHLHHIGDVDALRDDRITDVETADV